MQDGIQSVAFDKGSIYGCVCNRGQTAVGQHVAADNLEMQLDL